MHTIDLHCHLSTQRVVSVGPKYEFHRSLQPFNELTIYGRKLVGLWSNSG